MARALRHPEHTTELSWPTVLVGRGEALPAFEEALDVSSAGSFQFLLLVGEPGAGKTRLLGELAAAAARRDLGSRSGRAAEFEQELPFGAVVDALDELVEASLPGLADRLGAETSALLATVLPAMRRLARPAIPAASGPGSDLSGRLRVYRAMRRLLEDLAVPDGLVLILDDMHWADSASVELLDYLVRHPPRGQVLVAIAYRPAQASARLAALLGSAAAHGREVPVGPLTLAETEELLGQAVSRTHCQALHEASGGNPFYLEALARMGAQAQLSAGSSDDSELPPAVRTALRLELAGLSPASLRVAQAAAVAADEFEPALAAVAAEVSEAEALAALNEMAARDIVRPGVGRAAAVPAPAGAPRGLRLRRRLAGGWARTRGSPRTWPRSARPRRCGRITSRGQRRSATRRASPRWCRRPATWRRRRRPPRRTGWRRRWRSCRSRPGILTVSLSCCSRSPGCGR